MSPDWPARKLGDLVDPDRKIAYGVLKPGDEDPLGVPLVRAMDIKDGRVLFEQLRTITQDLSNQYRRTILRGGELLMSLVGTPGEVALAPDLLAGANVNRATAVIPLNDSVCHRYVMYYLRSPEGRNHVLARQTGSVQVVVNLGDLRTVPIPLPPLRQQNVIADILGSIDDLIENNRRRVAVLEEMARAVYREWFVRFRYPGPVDVPLVDSPLGPIPKGWSVAVLGDLATEIRRSVQPSGDTAALPYVPIDAIDSRSVILRNHRPGDEAASSLRLFRRGDVLFGAMRAYFHKVCIAPFDGVTRSTCFVLRPDSERYWYAVLTLADPETVTYAAAHSSGSTIPYAKWDGVLDRMPVVAPPLSLMSRFSKAVEPLLRAARPLVEQASQLAAIRDLLLPKLVTGQIDVSRLDLDALTEAAIA